MNHINGVGRQYNLEQIHTYKHASIHASMHPSIHPSIHPPIYYIHIQTYVDAYVSLILHADSVCIHMVFDWGTSQ